MTAVQITEYTYTATRKYHDFDQSANTADTPACYDTLTDFLDALHAGTATTGMAIPEVATFSAQKQYIAVGRVAGTSPVGKYSIVANVHIPNSTEKSQGRSDITNFYHLTHFCISINNDWAEELGGGFETAHPENSTKNNICANGKDVTFKNGGTALAATGALKVDNSYAKITFDKTVVLADAQAAAAAADTQMDNYDIFTREA